MAFMAWNSAFLVWAIHKPCSKHGKGVTNCPYLVKWYANREGGVKKCPKIVHMVYGGPLFQMYSNFGQWTSFTKMISAWHILSCFT